MTDIEMAIRQLQNNGLVVYPTDTLYALGASINSKRAVKKLYMAKNRPIDYPLSIAVADVESIESVAITNKQSRDLARVFLPGPLTLVLKKRNNVPSLISRSTIAVRVPNHPIAQELIQKVGPLTATSANRHDGPSPTTINQAKDQLGSHVACYLDDGILPGIPSTIVDATMGLSILREGAIEAKEVYAYRS